MLCVLIQFEMTRQLDNFRPGADDGHYFHFFIEPSFDSGVKVGWASTHPSFPESSQLIGRHKRKVLSCFLNDLSNCRSSFLRMVRLLFRKYLLKRTSRSCLEITSLLTKLYKPQRFSSVAFFMALARVSVVTPVHRAPVNPWMVPVCFINQLNRPMPFSFMSGPIMELRKVRFLSSSTSPNALVRSKKIYHRENCFHNRPGIAQRRSRYSCGLNWFLSLMVSAIKCGR